MVNAVPISTGILRYTVQQTREKYVGEEPNGLAQ